MHTSARPAEQRINYAMRIKVSQIWWRALRCEITPVCAIALLQIAGLSRDGALRVLAKPSRHQQTKEARNAA
ncbi:MAG TPA: hypothetical protein VLC92_01290 [Rhodocyclaceae bacterium]|nr:hypothetical protein [Rhodocyclaceae bacterium]